MLYTDREAACRLNFLATSTPSKSFVDIPHDNGRMDLTEDLLVAVKRLRDRGLDVIVVDQTTPEHTAGGFHCVKVIVPGLLPMTFGHDNRRIHGLPRLFEVPQVLGYRDAPLLPSEVNPYPHPFP